MPKGIQRRRAKGWKMPPGAIYVGRPSRWGNPFFVGQPTDDFPLWLVGHYGKDRLGPTVIDAQQAIDLYRHWVVYKALENPYLYNLKALTGHDLACWCAIGKPCHRDVLLDLANPVTTPLAAAPAGKRRKIGDRVWVVPGASFGASHGEWATIIDWVSNQPDELMPCLICMEPACMEFNDLVTDDGRCFFHVSECQMMDAPQPSKGKS